MYIRLQVAMWQVEESWGLSLQDGEGGSGRRRSSCLYFTLDFAHGLRWEHFNYPLSMAREGPSLE